jgi:ribosomal RNA assembly protein
MFKHMDDEPRFEYQLKVPKERVAVLIGKDGEVKKYIEEETGTEIDVDSKEGEVTVSGTDGLDLMTAREIIKAIARGFNPDLAKLLLKQDYALEIMKISDYAKTQNDCLRLKGRVIGREGKSRRFIENLTDCHISVYGKTLAIIGETEKLAIARKAVDALLRGSQHSRVFQWLERQKRQGRNSDFRSIEFN